MNNRIRPLGDRVLIQHKPQEAVTAGGVILPADLAPGKTPTEFGIIIECGEGVANKNLDAGVEVVFHRHAGAELEIDGTKCQLLMEESILALVDPHSTIEGEAVNATA